MCLNWKVVAGAVAFAAGLVLFAPAQVSALAPLLIVAVCPLSMLLMMRGMQGSKSSQATEVSDRTEIERLRSEVAELRRRSDRPPT